MVLITIFIVVCGSIVEVDAIAVDNIASKISPLIHGVQSGRVHELPNFTLQWTTALVIVLNKLVDEAMSHSEVCGARCVALPQPATMEHVNNVFEGATFELLILMPYVVFTISKQVFYANKCGCARNIKHLNSRRQIVWSPIIL